MLIDYNVGIPFYDGARSSAIVCRPKGPGPFTCVLTRTCYTKWAASLPDRIRFWTSSGFVFVVQDVRGRGDSQGLFYPLIHEQQDGLATLDWLAAQSWSDGRVVMVGGSYSGWTQLYVAGTNHPALSALVPMVTPPDPDRSFPRHHGIPVPSAAAWLASLDGQTNQDLSSCDIPGAFTRFPIIDLDRHLGRHLPAWRDYVKHPPGDPYWRQQSYQRELLESRIPMLHISGWYDDCLIGALENFRAMTGEGRNDKERAAQRLIIGPWTHGGIGKRSIGEVDYGADAELDMLELQRDWFNVRLQGEQDASAPVKVFVMGRNQWIEAPTWPLPGTSYQPYYFHSDGQANGREGDGTLSTAIPADEPCDRFRYDPLNPVPYCAHFDWRQVGGPDDFSQIELRDDILVFTGPILTEPMLICGPLQVRLFASSSALDTDWTAKLLDVYPDGRAIRLNDGVIRARYRRHTGRAELLSPGAIEHYHIDCWATCIELPTSHRLRVEISSSAFGKTDVNLNGGGPPGDETVPVVAEQIIYHDRQRPSHILLPIITGGA